MRNINAYFSEYCERFADMHVPYIVMHVEGMVRATLVRVNGEGSLRDRAPEEVHVALSSLVCLSLCV